MDDLAMRTEALCRLIEKQTGARGKDLAAQVRRLGRSLPRALRREAGVILDAHALDKHPKFARQVDARRVDAAFDALTRYFEALDPKERRIAQAISIASSFALGVLVLGVCTLAVLYWRGLI